MSDATGTAHASVRLCVAKASLAEQTAHIHFLSRLGFGVCDDPVPTTSMKLKFRLVYLFLSCSSDLISEGLQFILHGMFVCIPFAIYVYL